MESQDSQCLIIEEQALSNHLVLESVFLNLDLHTLLQCRLINSTWNLVACKFLEGKFVVRVPRLQKFLDTFSSSIPGISISVSNLEYSVSPAYPPPQHLAKIQAVCAVQVKQLELDIDLQRQMSRSLNNTDEHVEAADCITLGKCVERALELIYCYCPQLCSLRINLKVDMEDPLVFKSSPMNYFQTIINNYQNKNIVNLKNVEFAFKFRGCVVPAAGNGESSLCGCLIKTLLNSAQKLESLKLVGFSFEEAPLVKQHFIHTLLSSVSCHHHHLKEIKIFHSPISASNLSLLASRHFSLLELVQLKIDTESVTIPGFKDLLSNNCQRLQELELDFTGAHALAMLPFPGGVTMTRLHSLTLHNFHGPIEFGRLPKLNSLSLKSCPLQESTHCPLLCPPASKFNLDKLLISFPVKSREKLLSFPVVMRLPSLMISNLSVLTLECGLSPGMLPQIFEECQRLVRLNLWECQGGVTDELLCGMRGSLLNVAWPAVTVYSEDIVRFRPLVTQAMSSKEQMANRSSAFIGDLKSLRYLSIKERHSTMLTDASVLFGIIHCKKLKELELKSTKVTYYRSFLIIRIAGLPDLCRMKT